VHVQVKELTENQSELTTELHTVVEERNELSLKLNNMFCEKNAVQSQLNSTASVCTLNRLFNLEFCY
jgi:FtsZ-binding cell division protein ZapB